LAKRLKEFCQRGRSEQFLAKPHSVGLDRVVNHPCADYVTFYGLDSKSSFLEKKIDLKFYSSLLEAFDAELLEFVDG